MHIPDVDFVSGDGLRAGSPCRLDFCQDVLLPLRCLPAASLMLSSCMSWSSTAERLGFRIQTSDRLDSSRFCTACDNLPQELTKALSSRDPSLNTKLAL